MAKSKNPDDGVNTWGADCSCCIQYVMNASDMLCVRVLFAVSIRNDSPKHS